MHLPIELTCNFTIFMMSFGSFYWFDTHNKCNFLVNSVFLALFSILAPIPTSSILLLLQLFPCDILRERVYSALAELILIFVSMRRRCYKCNCLHLCMTHLLTHTQFRRTDNHDDGTFAWCWLEYTNSSQQIHYLDMTFEWRETLPHIHTHTFVQMRENERKTKNVSIKMPAAKRIFNMNGNVRKGREIKPKTPTQKWNR